MELSIILVVLVILLLFSVVLIVGPTCANFYVSYFLAKKTSKIFKNKYVAISAILAFSLIIGLNFRMPILISRIFFTETELKVIEKQKSISRERIKLISGFDTFFYKKNPLETISVGGNEGCMCFYYEYPKIEKINIKQVLLAHGLPVTYTKESTYSVVVEEGESGNYIENINIKIFKNKSIIATAKEGYIKDFPMEDAIFESKSNVLKFTIYLLQHNIWNYLFSMLPSFHIQEDLLGKIITSTFDVPSNVKISHKNILKSIPVSDHVKKSKYSLPMGLNGDIISTNNIVTKITYNVLASTHEEIIYPIRSNIPWHKIEKVLSMGDYIYIFETRPENIIIEIYSLQGEFLTSFDIILSEIKLSGAPRKPLVYFEQTEDGFFFSLVEFGDKIDDKEYMFYAPVQIGRII